MITRFMQVMFSNNDEELANQVDKDIKAAQENGTVDTEEVKYERTPDGDVAITDKENGEVTIAQKATDETDTYDLIAVPDEQLEKFLHPSEDGVHEGEQVGAPDEHIMDHFHEGDVISPNLPDGGLNPEAGFEKTVDERYENDEEKEFSVMTDNAVVQKIFDDQEFCERIFSEVIESEETAKVGDLKIEKIDDDAVVVTNETTGDQAKVVLEDDDMTVTELDSKNFSEEVGGYLPMFVVGVQPFDHIIVDSPVYGQEAAEALAARFTEDGLDAVEIFEDPEEARDYAMKLIDGLNAELPEDEEPVEEKEYSDLLGVPVYSTRFYSDNSYVMCKMFSEAVNGIGDLQDEVEDAIREGDEIEMDDIVITPVDAQNAVIEDKETGEFTKATMTGEDMRLEQIDEDEYNDLTGDLSVLQSESEIDQPLSDDDDVCPECGNEECTCKDEDEEDEKEYSYLDEDELYENEYSDIDEDELYENEYSYCDETETRFFSENEEFTDYMERIYSGSSEQDAIEDAIENGDQVETDTEIITPVDSKTAVVEDKESGEFTKATIINEDAINLHPISEDEAENLTDDLGVDESSAVDEDEEEEEKEYSYCDETETRFFSEGEEFTNYMERIYSEDADQDEIEKAIEQGEQLENDDEVITPVDSKTAIIEDKKTGEFTKATLDNDEEMDLTKISEAEADELTDGLAVEDNDVDEEEEEKKYSTLGKFFSDIQQQAVAPAVSPQQAVAPAAQPVAGPVDQGVPVDPNGQPMPPVETHTVEEVEDKALAAVQSIKAAAEEAAATIMEAKATPVEGVEPDIQEAQFSEKTFSDGEDTLTTWLNFKN